MWHIFTVRSIRLDINSLNLNNMPGKGHLGQFDRLSPRSSRRELQTRPTRTLKPMFQDSTNIGVSIS